MNVPDLPTLNMLLGQCGCCTLPECQNMETICESVDATRFGSESDYTDDLAAWTAIRDRHNTWEIEHAAFPAAYAAWVIAQAAWVACRAIIPCVECGTAPVEPVDPPEPPLEGTMPTMPGGYLDSFHGLWAPFVEPAVALDEIVPTLYRTLTETDAFSVDGDSWWYRGGTSDEFLAHAVHAGIGVSVTKTGNLIDEFDVCASGYIDYGFDDGYYEAGTPAGTIECTATTQVEDNGFTSISGGALTLQGCGADPWSGDETTWNVVVTDTFTTTLGEAITPASLLAEAVAKLPATWPTVDVVMGECVASYTLVWPTKQELYVGADPGADPPEIGAWTTCEAGARSAAGSGPTLVQANVTKIRYKVGIPLTMQAHRLWIPLHAAWTIAHARWVTCGSEEGSEPIEPVEPQIFNYFAAQWDWVYFPPEWEAWEAIYLVWVAATDAHNAWQIEQDEWDACELLTPGECGTEPVEPFVPPDPSGDQPADQPVFIEEDLFWEWFGGETLATQYSDWQTVIEPPDSPGRVEMVNRQVKCFRDALRGSPPTFYGRTYNVDDYPA